MQFCLKTLESSLLRPVADWPASAVRKIVFQKETGCMHEYTVE